MISFSPHSQTSCEESAAAGVARVVAITKPTDSPSAQRVMRSLSVVAAALQRLNVRRPAAPVAGPRQPARQHRDKPHLMDARGRNKLPGACVRSPLGELFLGELLRELGIDTIAEL